MMALVEMAKLSPMTYTCLPSGATARVEGRTRAAEVL
jgi:hypothetical protein